MKAQTSPKQSSKTTVETFSGSPETAWVSATPRQHPHGTAMIRGMSLTVALAAALSYSLAGMTAEAQVAVSVSGQEIYDNNIYIEDDTGVSPALDTSRLPKDQAGNPIIPESLDGDPNDDFISVASLAFSGAIPMSPSLDTSGSLKVGTFFFSSNPDESRFSVDSLLTLSPKEELLPKPFGLSLSSAFSSSSQNVGVASGSIARNSLSHDASLGLHLGEFALSDATSLGFEYGLTRHDFIGDLNYKKREGEDALKEHGADYFLNTLVGSLKQTLSPKTVASFDSGIGIYTFTGSDSADATDSLAGSSVSEADRLDWTNTIGVSYSATESLALSSNVGFTYTSYLEDGTSTPIAVDQALGGTTGQTTVVAKSSDDSSTSLVFGGGVSYSPLPETNIATKIDQSVANNIDGGRLLVRTVSADISQSIGERYDLVLGGQLIQFQDGNSLSDSTDRYEATASFRAAITESIGLTLGTNYANQVKGDSVETAFVREGDYEVLRAFITLDVGLVAD